MKQDIDFTPVEGVSVAIVPDEQGATVGLAGQVAWQVFLLNGNDFPLNNVLISSEGYGQQPTGETVRTSTLRYHFEHVAPRSAVPVELIDPAVFHLTNHYWVSYYHENKIFDKKFVFVPDSLVPENLHPLALLDGRIGVLHG